MSEPTYFLQTEFQFGRTVVRVIEGDIARPQVTVDAIASTDDNHLTMGSGVARLLADRAGPDYVAAAQACGPLKAGSVAATAPYRLLDHGLDIKCVLHCAIVDYDTYDLPLAQIVYQATVNCLDQAESHNLASVLLPAMATGAAGLAMEICAQQMCGAIKGYLAQERNLGAIYLLLYAPPDAGSDDVAAYYADRNRRFLAEANLILGAPYNPAENERQIYDVYERAALLQQLVDLAEGEPGARRHAVILGGPGVGAAALLDQLARRLGSPPGPPAVHVTFGRVHKNTPASFIYRKLLIGLYACEADAAARRRLKAAYTDVQLDSARFLAFLDAAAGRYDGLKLLIDQLPRLLQMGAEEFWRDLDALAARARLIFTALDDDQYQALLGRLSPGFTDSLAVVRIGCVAENERRDWIERLYQRYLGRAATDLEHDFFAEEAGCHPFLIGLTGYALIGALERDRVAGSPGPPYDSGPALAPFFQAARATIEGPRRAFFDQLMGPLIGPDDRTDLQSLAKAVVIETERTQLLPDLERGDPNARARWQALEKEVDPRRHLHAETLRRLAERGYLAAGDAPQTAQPMAPSFARWLADYFGVAPRDTDDDQPHDVTISLLSPEPQVISTLFHGRGARILTARKPLLADIKAEFMKGFGETLDRLLHPALHPDPPPFRDLEEVGNYILTQFTTSAIKTYLQNPPKGSTITLVIHDLLNDIPWELMLETAYAGEIPFRAGRSVVSAQQPQNLRPPVRGEGRVRALLIGDPSDDLPEARAEVQKLADRLRRDPGFAPPDVLLGSEQCRRLALLTALGSGAYGLIHYSGHTRFDGYRSAWLLKDGATITTDLLTNALGTAPPALAFSSSCASAAGGEPQPLIYENQTFDLPGAFLQAGVEAYIGTLWDVESLAARRISEAFYDALLGRAGNLGECLRRAKWALKQRDPINGLAFILYGDPYAELGDLFPVLRPPHP